MIKERIEGRYMTSHVFYLISAIDVSLFYHSGNYAQRYGTSL